MRPQIKEIFEYLLANQESWDPFARDYDKEQPIFFGININLKEKCGYSLQVNQVSIYIFGDTDYDVSLNKQEIEFFNANITPIIQGMLEERDIKQLDEIVRLLNAPPTPKNISPDIPKQNFLSKLKEYLTIE